MTDKEKLDALRETLEWAKDGRNETIRLAENCLFNSAEWLIGLAERALDMEALRLEAKAEALEELLAAEVPVCMPAGERYRLKQAAAQYRAEAAKLQEDL